MALIVTIDSKGPSSEQFEITLEKTAAEKGIIRVKSWDQGQNPNTDDPAKDELVKLYDIRSRTAQEIFCKGDVTGPDPVITCTLLDGASGAPSVQVDIRGTMFAVFDGTTRYPVTAPDLARLKKFLADAAFPPQGD